MRKGRDSPPASASQTSESMSRSQDRALIGSVASPNSLACAASQAACLSVRGARLCEPSLPASEYC